MCTGIRGASSPGSKRPSRCVERQSVSGFSRPIQTSIAPLLWTCGAALEIHRHSFADLALALFFESEVYHGKAGVSKTRAGYNVTRHDRLHHETGCLRMRRRALVLCNARQKRALAARRALCSIYRTVGEPPNEGRRAGYGCSAATVATLGLALGVEVFVRVVTSSE